MPILAIVVESMPGPRGVSAADHRDEKWILGMDDTFREHALGAFGPVGPSS